MQIIKIKALALFLIGNEPMENGMRIIRMLILILQD